MWSESAVALVRREWTAGLSASQISGQLARELRVQKTRNAIIGKLHRLGLTGRKPYTNADKARIARKRAVTVHLRQRRAVAPQAIFAPDPLDLKPIDPTLNSVHRLNNFTCRYPIGDPQEPGFAFCGRTCGDGPYCVGHAALTYTASSKRQIDATARLARWLDSRGRSQVMAA